MYKNQYIPRGIFQRPETNMLNMATSFSKKLATAMILVLMCFGVQKVSATHIVGGEISYRSLGMMGMNLEKFEVTLTVYRDCNTINPNAVFDDPGRIAIFHTRPDGTIFYEYSTLPFRMGDDTISTNINPACDPVASNICVHRTVYRDTIRLDKVEGTYTLAYQRCCRNVTVSNIVEPLETGMTIAVEISAEARAQANAGPVFNTWPEVYICLGEPLSYDHSATDTEADSVVYRLCTPYHGATRSVPIPVIPGPPPYQEVIWAPGFSTANMLGGSDPLEIDPNTGLLTATPEIQGQFLVGVCMDEYRGGVFYSTTRRDFEYNVIACGEIPTAGFNAPDLQCGDLTVTFENTSDPIAEDFQWYFNWPSTTLSSIVRNPTFTFPDTGTYVVALIADNGSGCTDTIFKTIVLRDTGIDVDFTYEQYLCGDSLTSFFIDISTDTVSTLVTNVWTIMYGDTTITLTNILDPILNLPEGIPITVTLTVTAENGCTGTITKEFISESEVGLIPDFDTEIIKCNDTYTINVTDTSLDALGDILTWKYVLTYGPNNMQMSIDSNPTFVVEGFQTVTLTLTITSTTGCEGTITRTFPLNPDIDLTPDFDFEVTECDSILRINFTDESFNGPPGPKITGWSWVVIANGGNPLPFATPNITVTYETSVDLTVSLTLTYDNGCVSTTTKEYEFNLLGDLDWQEEYELCPGKSVQLNVNPNIPDLQYIWAPAASLDNATAESPWASPEVTTTYSVTITDPVTGCSIVRETTVTVKDAERADFTFETECGITEVTFTKTAGGPVVRWEFGDKIPSSIATGDPTTTFTYPDTSRTYIVTLYTGGECPDTISKEVKVTFIDTDFIIDSIPSCDGDTVFLNPNFNPAYSYEWAPADKLLDPFNTPNPRAYVTETTTFTVTIFNLSVDPCGITKEVTVFVPDPITLNTDSFLQLCKDTTVRLIAFSPTAASYTWVNQNGDTLGIGDTIDVFLETDDVITVIVIDIFGCRIEKSVAVEFFRVVFNSENPLCIGDTTDIFINVPNMDSVATYLWGPADQIISGGTTNSIRVSPSQTTVYNVTVTYEDGCVLNGTYTQVVSGFMANMSISMDPDTIISGNTSTLTVTPCPSEYTFNWEPSNLVVDPNSCVTETVELEENTIFTVTITNEDGCELVLSTTVTVTDPRCEEPFIFLPNLFTPNGDNINDVLYVRAFEPFITSVELLIYNRYGTEVFKSTSLTSGWDGTFQGEALQTDAFGFYLKVICIDGQTFTKKGSVTLIR